MEWSGMKSLWLISLLVKTVYCTAFDVLVDWNLGILSQLFIAAISLSPIISDALDMREYAKERAKGNGRSDVFTDPK